MPTTLDQMLMDLRRRRQQQLDSILQQANTTRTQPPAMAASAPAGGGGLLHQALGMAAKGAGPDISNFLHSAAAPATAPMGPAVQAATGTGLPGALGTLGGAAFGTGAAAAGAALTPVGTATGEGIAALLPLLALA
jgi:hypothetical protein